MSHTNNYILKKFKKISHAKDDAIEEWFPNGINSIRIRLTNNTEVSFTWLEADNWKIESINISKQIKLYIKEKFKVLKELGIVLTETEKNHLKSLTREIDIDNYCHDLIMGRRH